MYFSMGHADIVWCWKVCVCGGGRGNSMAMNYDVAPLSIHNLIRRIVNLMTMLKFQMFQYKLEHLRYQNATFLRRKAV